VDLTAQLLADPGMLLRVLRIIEADPGVDIIVFQIAVAAGAHLERLARDVASVATTTSKVVSVSCPQRAVADIFSRAGTLTFDDPTVALRSLACLAEATRRRPQWLVRTEASPPSPLAATPVEAERTSTEGFLSEWESRRYLEPFGLQFAASVLAKDETEAAGAAGALGYPVVVKVCSPDLPHKSDVGGVALGLRNARAVRNACGRIRGAVVRSAPAARWEGFLVQRQTAGTLELALGVKADPVFGPVVLVGSGGLLAETLRDFQLLLPPIDAAAAEGALRALRLAALWDGTRGGHALDLPAAIDLVRRLGDAACALADQVSEIDLNPVVVGWRGDGVAVVDALVRRAEPRAGGSQPSHP
jgi:acyl-CoA synthetase (NDP forming)